MNTVIKVENLSKQYRLGNVSMGTLSHDLNRWWHGVRGKEDPYLKIGEENDRSKKGLSEYVWALKDINFDVKHGEVLGIIGRNGAGKSTLLKVLSRTTTPTKGSVKIKGRVASLLEVGTGFHPELSGRENIFLNGAILGMTKKEIKNKFDEIVDFAGVERYIDTPVKRYSSGMYVRLAFGVAAHLEPEILIVDEVLAVGDLEFQKKALGKIRDVSENYGRTVLFVSHNMEAIKKLCQRSIYLEKGKIIKDSNTESVFNFYVKALRKNFEEKSSVANYRIHENIVVDFRIDTSSLNSFDNLQFEVSIASDKINPLNGLTILFYNLNEERIAIVDLRSEELFQSSFMNKKTTVKGTIDKIPFIAGEYFIGLSVGSKLCVGNFLNLLYLKINESANGEIQEYPLSVLGYINLKSSVRVI